MKKRDPEPEPAPAKEPPTPARARKATAPPAEPGPEQRKPDFFWSGLPVFRCRLCRDQYERVNNLAAVLDHEATQHPTNARVSSVLGPGGQPLIVVD